MESGILKSPYLSTDCNTDFSEPHLNEFSRTFIEFEFLYWFQMTLYWPHERMLLPSAVTSHRSVHGFEELQGKTLRAVPVSTKNR